MTVRKTKPEDLKEVMKIYAYARGQMEKNGNPTQWGKHNPSEQTIKNDINNGDSYVIEESGSICGVFSFLFGADKTYRIIEGKWLNDKPYGTIHRIAGNGRAKGILEKCIQFCENKISNIRVDTHENNVIMKHLLEKNGFERCGTIYVADGSPRIAYQRYRI